MSLLADLFPSGQTSRRIVVGFTTAMLLVSVGFGIALYSYEESKRDNQRINHTFEVISSINTILSLLKDVETGARGYAATGVTSFLEPYQAARPQLVPDLNNLDSLIADNPVQQWASRQLRGLVLAKLATTDRQVLVGQQESDSVQ